MPSVSANEVGFDFGRLSYCKAGSDFRWLKGASKGNLYQREAAGLLRLRARDPSEHFLGIFCTLDPFQCLESADSVTVGKCFCFLGAS